MTQRISSRSQSSVASDAIDAARAYVEENHPNALASVLGGSSAADTATSTSDLDIAILYPNGHSSYAATTRFRGWLIEAFVHTPESLEFWYEKEARERRPIIADICARGILLTDGGSGEQWQSRAREQMVQCPRPLESGERDLRRYSLSALIDDLFHDATELLLLESGSWLGGGKWVIRRLRLNGSDLATRMSTWAADPERTVDSLVVLAREVLELSGGYVQEGFTRGKPC
jgi:hypothetical protein